MQTGITDHLELGEEEKGLIRNEGRHYSHVYILQKAMLCEKHTTSPLTSLRLIIHPQNPTNMLLPILTVLTTAAAAALALPGPLLHPRDDWLTVTGYNYTGTGCPDGSLTGQFWPATNTFNITIASTKAALGKCPLSFPPTQEKKKRLLTLFPHKKDDNSSTSIVTCYVNIFLRTAAHSQVNIHRGDFLGHVYLSAPGMTAYEQNTYSFAAANGTSLRQTAGWHQMRWEFEGPADLDTVFANELETAFVSPCGGEFALQIDNVLGLERGGERVVGGAEGFVELSRLTGTLGHALVLEERVC